ncbi:MAG: hypothetical protein R3Y59_06840 [bacterium]
MAYPYAGSLNRNLVLTSIFNMIISQEVFPIGVKDPTLADYVRVDGTLFGDEKLFYSMDIDYPKQYASATYSLNTDRLAPNLLNLHRNKSIVCQSIKMAEYYYTEITTDTFLSKNAFKEEGTFAVMIGVMKNSLKQIKKVYDNALINCAFGTHKSTATGANITIPLPTIDPETTIDTEAYNRLVAQSIAKELVVTKANLEDNTRNYNEIAYLRSHSPSEMMVIWNVEQRANITKMDLPTIFHREGLESTGLKEFDITSRWFGDINTTNTVATGNSNIRCAVCGWYNVSATIASFVPDYAMQTEAVKTNCIYLYAGDNLPSVGDYLIPSIQTTVNVVSTTFPANYSYTVDSNVLFVMCDKRCLPYMSGFVSGTEFWNALSDTTNSYYKFGHSILEFLVDKPFVRFSLASS